MWRRDRIGFGAGTLAFAAVACGGLVSCGGDGPTSFGGGGPQLAVPQPPDALRQPSKIANIVEQMTFLCRQRVARGGDFSLLSHRLVHVSPVGEIEVVVHARTTITAAQEAQLIALGGRIAARLDPPAMSHMPIAGMVHVWLPHDALDKAAQLPWVVAITRNIDSN